MNPFRRVPLRTLLALVVLATTGSFVVFAGWQAESVRRNHREAITRQNVDIVRAVSGAVDGDVRSSLNALSVLATLDVLQSPQALDAFADAALRLVRTQAHWHAVLLADGRGRELMNVAERHPRQASGQPVPWARAVLASGMTSISGLLEEPGEPGHYFIIATPVLRDDTRFVLGAMISTERLSGVLRSQAIETERVLALIDADLRIMARTRDEARRIGGPPSPDFAEAAQRMDEGSWESVLLEGTPAYAALKRSPLTSWTVGLGVPQERINGPLRANMTRLIAVGIIVLIVGTWSVLLLARGIVPALDKAGHAANALARDEPLPPLQSRIAEVARLFEGMHDAEQTLRARRQERDDAERRRARAAEEREAALRAEQHARQDAEHANRLKDEFLMAVSHELRTPLTAIRGWARMLQSGQIAEAQRLRAVETIDRNAHALTQLVNDLLDVSQAGSGKLRLDIRHVRVQDVIGAALATIQPAAAARNISLAVHAEPAPLIVQADPDRLQQMIWNLVANAVKFTPPEGHVVVSAGRRDERVEIAVWDDGPGIDPAFLPYAFDAFRQGAAGLVRVHGGLGLGLAIVRQLTELHGGTVEAFNNPDGRGATFRLVLPVLAASLPPDPRTSHGGGVPA